MPPGRNKPLSASEELAILEAYQAWPFIKDLARRMGHSLTTIRGVLDAAGLRGGIPIDEVEL